LNSTLLLTALNLLNSWYASTIYHFNAFTLNDNLFYSIDDEEENYFEIKNTISNEFHDHRSKYRLEMIHIPKNAGTQLEVLAMKKNITWGACHFNFGWKRNKKNIMRNCPQLYDDNSKVRMTSWHQPIHIMKEHLHDFKAQRIKKRESWFHIDPYDNLHIDNYHNLVNKTKKYFTVVRNPYDRYISLWRMSWSNTLRQNFDLNEWIIKSFEANDKNFWFCQYEYVFDEEGNRVVDTDHIIHFENLKEEFEALANDVYGLNLTIPTNNENIKMFAGKNKRMATPLDFNNTSLELIHEKCGRDFELGPYQKI